MDINWDPWQVRFKEQKGDKILCCGRQIGKTEVCSWDASDWALNNPKKIVLMIAPTERQARLLFNKTLNYLLSEHKSKVVVKGKDRPTKERIMLTNKTLILCLPTGVSGTGIRGLTVHRLYIDEASQVPEEVFIAIIPSLAATGGDTIMLSTPFGQQGEFYRTWINKDSAYDSFTRFDPEDPLTTEKVYQRRQISKAWTEKIRQKSLEKIEQAKARFSNRKFAQEYLGEFIEDLYRFFSDEDIEKTCVLKRTEKIPRGPVFLGVDIARMGEDESTFEIIERMQNGKLEHRQNIITRKTLTTQTEDKIRELHRQYRFRVIAIDAGSGSLGVGVYDSLLRTEVKSKIRAINNATRPYSFDGVERTKIIKEDLYETLRNAMQKGEIKLLDDDSVIESLRSIQYEFVTRQGKHVQIRIYGEYSHVVEGVIRAVWYAKAKHSNRWIRSIKL